MYTNTVFIDFRMTGLMGGYIDTVYFDKIPE
jgi:hypothetical protein